MALALATGHVSPRRMLGEMSLRDAGMWAALWSIDPWGEERADLRAAVTSQAVAESLRNPKTRPTPYKLRDFMPYATRDKRESARELSERLKAAFKRNR